MQARSTDSGLKVEQSSTIEVLTADAVGAGVLEKDQQGSAFDHSLAKWQMFVKAVYAHIDPVLASMLMETDFIDFDQNKKIIHLVTLKKFSIFQDLFIEQKPHYQEYLDRIFGFKTVLVVDFVKIIEKKKMDELKEQRAEFVAPAFSRTAKTESQSNDHVAYGRKGSSGSRSGSSDSSVRDSSVKVGLSKNEKNIDITDAKKWKFTHTLLEHFGGTVREIIKDSNEFDA